VSKRLIFDPSLLLPLVVGFLAFVIIVGPWALDPRSVSWLLHRDPMQHYLGWVFYRHAPWDFPVGLNPDFGLDISTSIVFSDSIPLFAILFKVLNPFLSEPFQYFGIWLLSCFVLQGLISWKLVGLFTSSRWMRFFGCGIFVFSPPMIYRLGWHMSLMAHFLILAALYLNFRPSQNRRIFYWSGLLALAGLIHFYLLAMVLSLWVANLLDQVLIRKRLGLQAWILELSVSLSLLTLVCWQAGYFVVSGESAQAIGYGISQVNLLGLFDSMGWSYLFKWIPSTTGIYEGFVFFGGGAIIVLLFAIPGALKKSCHLPASLQNHFFLVVTLLCMLAFALTNIVKIGSLTYSFPIPDALLAFASILRASSRIFWAVFYALMLTVIYLVIRAYPRKVAIGILGLGFFIQIIDSSAGWWPIHQFLQRESAEPVQSELKDPFWDAAAKYYQKVVLKPPLDMPPPEWFWGHFAQYASANRMGTNSVFLSRPDMAKSRQSSATYKQRLDRYEFDPNTLYILQDETAIALLPRLKSEDLISRINDFNVLAPGWRVCKECPQSQTVLQLSDLIKRVEINQIINFSKNGAGKLLLTSGWFIPEEWGVWAEDEKATLLLPLPASGAKSVQLEARAFVAPKHPVQTVAIWANGIFIKKVELTKGDQNLIDIPIPAKSLIPGYVSLEFEFLSRARPRDLGYNQDDRYLSMALVSAKFR
jgi:hypothetical protein